MRVAICSDIHLEFKKITLTNDEGADVLVLAGDILTANHIARKSYLIDSINAFMESCVDNFKDVIYIAGNHEHYDHDFQRTYNDIRNYFTKDEYQFKNLHILDKQTVEIDGVTFVGGTMWTDMNKSDPITLTDIRSIMNDFIIVTNHHGRRKFTPEDSVEDHQVMVKFILDSIKDASKKYVIVSHHAPSELSVSPAYKRNARDILMNGAYYSNLENMIMDHPQIKCWVHGHMHNPFDYMVRETRVICNPRGYPGQNNNFKLKYVDL